MASSSTTHLIHPLAGESSTSLDSESAVRPVLASGPRKSPSSLYVRVRKAIDPIAYLTFLFSRPNLVMERRQVRLALATATVLQTKYVTYGTSF